SQFYDTSNHLSSIYTLSLHDALPIFESTNDVKGDMWQRKRAFISQYKFTIAFENSSYPGYHTEKILDPMMVDSLPIYWGNPCIRSEEHTSELQSRFDIVCRLLLEKKN